MTDDATPAPDSAREAQAERLRALHAPERRKIDDIALRKRNYETRIIKRKLCLMGKTMLPMCPAKSNWTVKHLEKKGDFSHSDPKHLCPKCGCTYQAGYGTNHRGYGWCRYHELNKRRPFAKAFEEFHLKALQSRHPDFYRVEPEFIARLKEEARVSGKTVELRHEVDLLRSRVMKFIKKAEEGKLTGGYDKAGDPIPATDVAELKALVDAAKAISQITKDKLDTNSDNLITVDSFKIWIHAFASAVLRAFPDQKDHEKFSSCLSAVGEPRRGI